MGQTMTWAEFKKCVDDAGVKDDDEIWFIDITYPTDKGSLHIFHDENGDLGISDAY